ncbi:hypothetical protein BH11MYX4_BH11MYX4_69860 [soil metagenome]
MAFTITRTLPSPSTVNHLFTEYLAAHFEELIAGDELPIRQAVPAVLLALASGGRLDKRVHHNTAMLFAGTAALSLRYRDRERPARALAKLRADLAAIWERGTLVLTPTCTARPPKHGRTAFAYRLMTFCKLGNLTDATGLALPFGSYPAGAPERRWGLGPRAAGGSPPMPRLLQILGPAGSEDAVLDLAELLERAIAR